MTTVEQIIEIISKHQTELEQAATKWDEIVAEPTHRYIPHETIQRKQYAVSAQIELLQSILNEIEEEGLS